MKSVTKYLIKTGQYQKFTKIAESSALGRYLALKAQKSQLALDNPYHALGAAAATLPLGPAANIPNAIGLPEMYVNNAGIEEDGEAGIKRRRADAFKRNGHFGESFAHGVTSPQRPAAYYGLSSLLGAGVGAGVGALSGGSGGHIAATAGAGAALFPAVMALARGTGQALSDTISTNTSDETNNRARKMLMAHPTATALPFGDVVGAAKS